MPSEKWAEALHYERLAQKLRNEAARDAQLAQRRREKEFFDQTGIDLGISGDYAVMEVGKFRFYYGYEQPVIRSFDADVESEWGFVVWEDGQKTLHLAQSTVHPTNDEEPMFYLLAGPDAFQCPGTHHLYLIGI